MEMKVDQELLTTEKREDNYVATFGNSIKVWSKTGNKPIVTPDLIGQSSVIEKNTAE